MGMTAFCTAVVVHESARNPDFKPCIDVRTKTY